MFEVFISYRAVDISPLGYKNQSVNICYYIGFSLPTSFQQCSVLIHSYTLLLSEVKMDKTWKRFKTQCFFGNRGELNRKVLPLFFSRRIIAGFVIII
jgi:hypothetical protein